MIKRMPFLSAFLSVSPQSPSSHQLHFMVSGGTSVPSECRMQWAWPVRLIPRHRQGLKGAGGAELRMVPVYETLVAGGWMGVVETKLKCVVFNKCCWRKEEGGVLAWRRSGRIILLLACWRWVCGREIAGLWWESLSLVSGCLGWLHHLHLRFSFWRVGLVMIVTSLFHLEDWMRSDCPRETHNPGLNSVNIRNYCHYLRASCI